MQRRAPANLPFFWDIFPSLKLFLAVLLISSWQQQRAGVLRASPPMRLLLHCRLLAFPRPAVVCCLLRSGTPRRQVAVLRSQNPRLRRARLAVQHRAKRSQHPHSPAVRMSAAVTFWGLTQTCSETCGHAKTHAHFHLASS